MGIVSQPKLLVVDLEATCWEDKNDTSKVMEIIEIGAVLADSKTLEIMSEFQSFVKPILNPILSDYCLNLTTIKQEEVDSAEMFPSVLARLLDFCGETNDVTLASWGDYDRKQLILDCARFGVQYPFGADHLNIKELFTERKGSKKCGMKKALRILGIPLEGMHHRGLDDARNIFKILAILLNQPESIG